MSHKDEVQLNRMNQLQLEKHGLYNCLHSLSRHFRIHRDPNASYLGSHIILYDVFHVSAFHFVKCGLVVVVNFLAQRSLTQVYSK